MTSRDFCYWLQGYFEIQGMVAGLDHAQTDAVRAHLAMVFKHEIDPSMGGPKEQAILNQIHDDQKTNPLKLGGTGPNGEVYRC